MKIKAILLTIASLIMYLTACKPKDDHSGHDHSGHDHGEHAALEDDHNNQTEHVHDQHNEGDHEEHAEKTPGPNGGRLIQIVEPHFEFLIREDRHAQINFLDDEMKPVAVGDQELKLTGGNRANPFHLSFVKEGSSLVSEKPIPAGDDHPGVLQIKNNADAMTIIEQFQMDLSDCPTCNYKEYSCICEH